MRSIVSLIAAAAFLLHVWLGCCAHHHHAAAAEAWHACHSAEEHARHAHHHHGAAQHEHETPPGHDSPADPDRPHAHCEGDHCAITVAAKTVLAKQTCSAPLPLAADEQLTGSLASVSAAIDSGGGILPPVRLHLFYQVLLN